MIELTNRAIKKIKEERNKEETNKPNNQETEVEALRVAVRSGGCSGFSYGLYFDSVNDDDVSLYFDDLQIIVDNESLPYLNGTVIDYKEGLMGSGFDFQNPNVSRTCGCGKSFS